VESLAADHKIDVAAVHDLEKL
jgi:hypothetical protein